MFKRTTNYLFQTYGNIFYNLPKSKRLSTNTMEIDQKEFNTFYHSNSYTYINCDSGIALLVVSKDGQNYKEFVIHRVVRLNPGIYFNFISIPKKTKITLCYVPNDMDQKTMQQNYQYHPIVSSLTLKEILTCFYQVRKANYEFPGESHEYYELTYIDNGCLDTTVDGKTYHLTKYDLMIYYPGQFHTQSTDDKNTCSYLTITFDMDCKLEPSLKNRVFKTRKDIYTVLSRFMKAMQEIEYLNMELSLLYLKEVLILLYQFDTKKENERDANPMQKHYENTLLNEILIFIHNNMYNSFTVEDLCQKFSVSRSSLQSLFRDNLNTTPKQYISQLKLNHAKTLIQERKYTISEISDMLGFNSIHYFSRKFKLQYGLAPTDYAKSINQ